MVLSIVCVLMPPENRDTDEASYLYPFYSSQTLVPPQNTDAVLLCVPAGCETEISLHFNMCIQHVCCLTLGPLGIVHIHPRLFGNQLLCIRNVKLESGHLERKNGNNPQYRGLDSEYCFSPLWL